MTNEDIIRLALEHFGAVLKPSDLEVKLAALAVAAEREECAKIAYDSVSKVCEETAAVLRQLHEENERLRVAVLAEREACAKLCEELRPSKPEYDQRFHDGCAVCAAAIRARGENMTSEDEEFTREQVVSLLLEAMDWTYVQADRDRPMTDSEKKVIDDIRTALTATIQQEQQR